MKPSLERDMDIIALVIEPGYRPSLALAKTNWSLEFYLCLVTSQAA